MRFFKKIKAAAKFFFKFLNFTPRFKLFQKKLKKALDKKQKNTK